MGADIPLSWQQLNKKLNKHNMLILSIDSVLESSISESKNASGSISNMEFIRDKSNFIPLEKDHNGIFAFIAFHPKLDNRILEYLEKDTLSEDAGSKIFVLFANAEIAETPKFFDKDLNEDWIKIDKKEFPVYELIRELPFKKKEIKFPGILFIEKFSSPSTAVFVHLDSEINQENFIRNLFNSATSFYKESNNSFHKFLSKFSFYLTKNKIEFNTTNNTSFAIWLFRTREYVKKNFGDIVTIVKFFK